MLLSLRQCQLKHVHHVFIDIATYILGGWRWHGILWINWSPTRYLISLRLWRCVLWRSVWLLTKWGHLRWINDLIIVWRSHRYPRWWQLIVLWVNVLAIKVQVITRSCLLNTLIVSCFNLVATTNALWTGQDECSMSLWWCCVPFFCWVDGEKKSKTNLFGATNAVMFEFFYQE